MQLVEVHVRLVAIRIVEQLRLTEKRCSCAHERAVEPERWFFQHKLGMAGRHASQLRLGTAYRHALGRVARPLSRLAPGMVCLHGLDMVWRLRLCMGGLRHKVCPQVRLHELEE